MHLLAATPGAVDDGSEAVDLDQSPGDILILTAADTEIATLAAAQRRRLSEEPDAPRLRCANLMRLGHNLSVDLYVEKTLPGAKLVIGRLLGGRGYWPYGVDEVTAACRAAGIPVVWLPGDDQPDEELAGLGALGRAEGHRLWQYFVQGGVENAIHALRYAAHLIGRVPAVDWAEPAPLLRAGLYWPGVERPGLDDLPASGRARAAVIFYRALAQAGNTAVIDAMIAALDKAGLDALPIFAASLKDPVAAATVRDLLERGGARVVLNGTGFALSVPGAARAETPFDGVDGPVIQLVFSGGARSAWDEGTRGLSARDIAMNVALPEVDGRLLSRAVSFKGAARRDETVEADIVEYEPVPDRCRFAAEMAAGWVRLAEAPVASRRVGFVLANYPNKDARLGNGVGLDTPAGLVEVLTALGEAGYSIDGGFADGDALIAHLKAGPTNAATAGREERESLGFAEYQLFFQGLPDAVQAAVVERWGPAEADPFFKPGDVDCGRFVLPVFRLGNVAIGLQPARGYNIDPQTTYHDPDLVPPHGYIAFYAWLREAFGAHALVHMGKHGNLEWLPGKALALSDACFPEAVLGAVPHLYPFIVNDPGEGTQAKRRAQAVIIDHLTPPLTRAESYGPLKDLEQLVDEYYEAAGVDPRRLKHLGREIVELAERIGLAEDCGIARDEAEAEKLAKLDNYLCELKELQIRDGLHIFGRSPAGRLRRDLLLALARLPRGGDGGTAGGAAEGRESLLRALARDFALGTDFDPLDCAMGDPWTGPRPAALDGITDQPWRTAGDTVERLELFAAALLDALDAASAGGVPGDRASDSNNYPFYVMADRTFADSSKVTNATQPGDESRKMMEETGLHPDSGAWEQGESEPSILYYINHVMNDSQDNSPTPRSDGATDGAEAKDEPAGVAVLRAIRDGLAPAVDRCGPAEIAGLLTGLDGRFVAPGPSGAPTRGRPDVLPTGRNFYSVDTRTTPTPAAWTLGWKSAQLLVETHAQSHGAYPKRLALSCWGTANMRTGGDDIAQALALMGVKPTWDAASRRVTGFEILPADMLDRPRVDVTLRISGFFRDAFPNLIDLVDSAARAVAALEEDAATNPLAAAVREERAALEAEGTDAEAAARRAGARVFGAKPGAYGAGLQALIDEKLWETDDDLAAAYVEWGAYAYGAGSGDGQEGRPDAEGFARRLGRVEAVLHNQDNREHDLLDSDDYYQFEGGLTAAVRTLSGSQPAVYHNDHSRPESPRIRTLEDEIGRVVRARVVNPKWIAGVRRHGYKGAFEMAATVDYLFAFAATAKAVKDHHFDAVYDAYLDDAAVRDFLADANPDALRDIAARLLEAQDRGLWRPRRNDTADRLQALMRGG
ncbi:cobaltochelatase subunit CobN [Marivibrio halodurans]|uniref:Cobaltochelatase subunit CobN n=1 Tax=Marivibrio halodurans TaxID=2039722 RepID=A0A8J7V5C1_9PROT|nr:cobaltochelatase subunit CobN [Marivibrio halodurans]MBP5858724.1 cobaltochelatase subunit CobN [Marivibrio halodurans]